MRPSPAQRGAALILVLWMVVGLSLVVLAGARGVRLHTQQVALALDRQRAESLLDAAATLMAARLMGQPALTAAYRRVHVRLGEEQATVEIVPSSGLVDINVASEQLLQALFERVGGLEPGEAAILVSRVRDFIDPDDEPGGVGGAEAAQYIAAGSPARPRNGGVDDLSELRSVLGMSPELYEIIAPFLGINGGQKLDIGASPPALVDALTGQTGLGARLHATAPDMRAGLVSVDALGDYFALGGGAGGAKTVRLRAMVQTQGGRWWERQVWLDLSTRQGGLTPWTVRSIEPVRRLTSSEPSLNP